MDKKRILLVDDEDGIQLLYRGEFEDDGYLVDSARNGDEALARFRANPPDLVLLDIVMPGMDGIEVARLAAARHPGLRIMFITGFAAVALAAGESAPPGAKVLSKPIHLREIVTEVERMMAAA